MFIRVTGFDPPPMTSRLELSNWQLDTAERFLASMLSVMRIYDPELTRDPRQVEGINLVKSLLESIGGKVVAERTFHGAEAIYQVKKGNAQIPWVIFIEQKK
jgi:hypothetical protein